MTLPADSFADESKIRGDILKAWGITDVGIVRRQKANEDRYIIGEIAGTVIGVICDGMGGANAGDVASKIAIDVFAESIKEKIKKGGMKGIGAAVEQAVTLANDAIYKEAENNPECEGMGTTLVMAVAAHNEALVANIGDSRAYHITSNGMTRITTDHSLVSEMVMMGEITPVQAHHHPSRNLITRALGVDKSVKCDLYNLAVSAGEYILLCSDGLTDQVSEPEIYYEVFESGQPELACRNLVEIANKRGGADNITIVLIGF